MDNIAGASEKQHRFCLWVLCKIQSHFFFVWYGIFKSYAKFFMFVDMEWYRRKKCPECTTSSFTPKWGITSPWVFVSLRDSSRICFKCFNTSEKLALRNWVFKSKLAICFLDKLFQNLRTIDNHNQTSFRTMTITTKHLCDHWQPQPNNIIFQNHDHYNQTSLWPLTTATKQH